ncbi:bifunctional glycosyltransferase family 2 protein/CDP-glycerol:glycerophosphate glycerophosphotransferase [Streptomyces sp. P17]|uniref:bifunctional glycosyltransferase/CDP-glycerol:glycerophosphate glycerophosphotransferase n=1 Tax=Streptomyces sp. P17 TaxID=3074716 RepID=UPI0028F3E400|nr:bifunctional glycosyltransferase family 2 protein/CDP-glycerol:glycerophosphate glycerophosphotransferase [Streptomyces sp. P17]MDT9700606.1 bifunctional glycosyltransferase family 2 protein/CDP-glycerol:glycerophosphate glycerophosphotransferase [Streptomyces sp. P17]
MPRFSVIVPAYKVQAYLHACLESVLSQSCPDLELIPVDDASPDACGAIIDEFAARDARVRPVRLARNQGPGPARNAGMAEATGDYLLFLDGDDTLAPGALEAIADRLKETGEPDVLVHDYARTCWTGEAIRDQAFVQLTEQGPAPFRLEDRPGLLRLPMVAWNKAYRREFAAGFAFPPGHYEDAPWTYEVLLTAESIATLDRVCVHHRQRRTAGTRRHFEVFEQYDRVFAFLTERPELAPWRPVLFRRMLDTLTAVLARLPRGTRAEFLRLARAHCRRHRAPGAPASPRERLRHALVRLGLHRTYRTLRLAAALRRKAVKLTVKLAGTLRSAALRLHYRIQLRLPLRQDRAVFCAYGGQGHGCNPGALEQAFRTHAPHIRTAWIAHPGHHHTIPVGTRRITPGTAAYWTALARSRYLIDNEGLRLIKRPGQIVVQTQHGTPLKHMGLDLRERPAAAADMDFDALLDTVDTWDYVVSANRHSTLTWERVHPGAYRTLEYGQPRNDVFQQATSADVTRLRESLGIPENAVAILYAPTHRDYRRTQRTTLDLDHVVSRLGPRFVILARAHRRCGGPLAPDATSRQVIDVTAQPSVESLCLASDALLTDYSSIMFDYANLDRPIVLHADDQEAYEAARGTYFDVRAFPPGAVARSEDELIDIFATGHWRGSRSAQLRAAFRTRFCPYDDGRAAERVVRHVVFGEKGLPPVVPPAERHPVPSAACRARTPLTVPPQQAAPLSLTDRF